MIARVDEFVLYDDVQYTRRDWRNRNQIKTPQGQQWITVPVKTKGKYFQTIRATEIDGSIWKEEHWKAFAHFYRRAAHFDEVAALFKPLYLECRHTHLSGLNRVLIEAVCSYLGIETKITNSWDYSLIEGKTERLAALCVQAGASEYVSGPAAKGYIDERVFSALGIRLTWFDYADYPKYPQLWADFIHGVTILDLLFNCGKDAARYMKYVAPQEGYGQ
jgi:hypothetical protein